MNRPAVLLALILSVGLATAVSPASQPKPKVSLEEAIGLAKAFAKKHKIDLSTHYMDSVWIRPPEGDSDRCWIVSWAPNSEDAEKANGLIAIEVAFDGVATERKRGAKTKSLRQRVIVPPRSPE